MIVLLVHSGNSVSDSSEYSFVKSQGEALAAQGCKVVYFAVKGKGIRGYLCNLRRLRKVISKESPDIIHAHYGLCGALAVLQQKAPVVISFHNGETLTKKGMIISSLASFLSKYNIFVAQHIKDKLVTPKKRFSILPCGIDIDRMPMVEKRDAKRKTNLPEGIPNILFGGSFDNARKNYSLAQETLSLLGYPVNLIELKDWSRDEVHNLMCACDMLLLPTKSEGSPQVVKEAMACNCPVVATGVADIPFLLQGVKNSYVTSFDPREIAGCITRVLKDGGRSDGRDRVLQLGLDNESVAKKLKQIYTVILQNGKKQ